MYQIRTEMVGQIALRQIMKDKSQNYDDDFTD